ncbi:hypothetical protein ACVWXM_000857 [Bradyrhizobium sp. GM7.3]
MSRRAHRQRHHACNREAAVHFEQEGCDALHRGLAAQQQHVVLGVAKLTGGHRPKLAGDLDVGGCGLLEARALHEAHSGVDDSFSSKAVGGAGFEAEHVAGKVEGADLAAAVGEKLVAAHGAGDDLIDILGRLVLAIDFLFLAVGELGGNEADMAGDRTELVGDGMGGCDLARRSGS